MEPDGLLSVKDLRLYRTPPGTSIDGKIPQTSGVLKKSEKDVVAALEYGCENQEVKNTLNGALHEKFHRGGFKGCKNYFWHRQQTALNFSCGGKNRELFTS